MRYDQFAAIMLLVFVAAARADDVGQFLAEARAATAAAKHDVAVRVYTAALDRDPKLVAVRDARGDSYLKLGKFTEAIADFDAFLAAHPDRAAEHWRRGIALYFAGRYVDGVKQFDLHRTVNPEDVENSAWHYLCNVRATNRDTARKALLPVSKDARVPMAQVLELFAGKLQPRDVIAAADSAGLTGDRLTAARFYAHLYVGLYYEGDGDAKRAKEHITTAVEKYKVPGYMWDVANVHLKTLTGK
jgi:lipoprotein NlpI